MRNGLLLDNGEGHFICDHVTNNAVNKKTLTVEVPEWHAPCKLSLYMATMTNTFEKASRNKKRLIVISILVAIFSYFSGGIATWIYFKHTTRDFSSRLNKSEEAIRLANQSTRVISLDPFLVNLSDPDGNSYLRLGIALRIENKIDGSADKGNSEAVNQTAELRDAILDVLSRQSSVTLLSPNGKEILKKQILEEFITRKEQGKIVAVYFTEFLVQR